MIPFNRSDGAWCLYGRFVDSTAGRRRVTLELFGDVISSLVNEKIVGGSHVRLYLKTRYRFQIYAVVSFQKNTAAEK